MSYIPALSWSSSSRLSSLTSEPQWRAKAHKDMQAFIEGRTPAVADPYRLTSMAAAHAAIVGRLLTTDAGKLQRPDGLFIHAVDGPHAWGRGNGFALLGLTEALTCLPGSWTDRPRVLEIYRTHAKALASHQSVMAAGGRSLTSPRAIAS